ncbi:hypothetical protein N9777_04225 [Ascidiaceihabitans sp.]|nr:hypothetical protein [Ascidiaceihabitans sp.]
MSDPVTNIEVEDVLSSIRRLVSDDNRPSMKAAATVAQFSDRLILTPALRVANDQGEVVAESTIQAWSEFGADPEGHDANNAETSENGDDTGSEEHVSDDTEATFNHSKEKLHEDVAEKAAEPAPEPFVLEAVVCDVAPKIDGPSEDAEPDSSINEAAFFAGQTESLTSKIAALEAAIGKTDDQWEPDDTGGSDYSGTEAPSMKWGDAAEVSFDEDPEADSTMQHSGIASSADGILDEEALRDLISEIAREELQGALGERITRNVRKLVRREIRSALIAQELE